MIDTGRNLSKSDRARNQLGNIRFKLAACKLRILVNEHQFKIGSGESVDDGEIVFKDSKLKGKIESR